MTLIREQSVNAVRISSEGVIDSPARASVIWTAILAVLPSLYLAMMLPPLWQHADSMIFLLGQTTVALPHYPILYPMMSWMITGVFGYSSNAVVSMLVLQHLLLTGGVFYCLSTFPRFWHQIVLAVALFVGMRAHVFSHGILTEAFAFGLLIVFLGAFIRIALRGDIVGRSGVRDFAIYHAAFVLMCLSRVSFSCLALCLPFYFITKFFVSTDRKRLGVQAIISIVAGLTALTFTSVTTGVVLRAVGASNEPIVGRSGVYRIQSLPWNEMTTEDKTDLIQRAQANTKNDFVAQIIPILIMTPDPWVGPWRAVDALRREQGASIGTDSAMSAALLAFLKTMDHRLLKVIKDDITEYLTARNQIANAIEFATISIAYYQTSTDWPLARHIPAIVRGDPYGTFLRNPVLQLVDALPNYVPYVLAALALGTDLTLRFVRPTKLRGIQDNRLIAAVALLIAGAIYVILSCSVNIITEHALRYTVPVSGLGWVALALLVVAYIPARPADTMDGFGR